MAVQRGRFITLEGGEGSGKSTQARRLVAALSDAGIDTVSTREPGGSPGAEAIRALVLNGKTERWSPETELLLMYAARNDHLERTIRPALDSGRWVVCDRFADSSRAYQGAGGGVDDHSIEALDQFVVGETQPDLTLIFDLPVEAGLQRALSRAEANGQSETRFENKGLAFHHKLRDGFTRICAEHPQRCHIINAEGDQEAVFERVWAIVSPIVDRDGGGR